MENRAFRRVFVACLASILVAGCSSASPQAADPNPSELDTTCVGNFSALPKPMPELPASGLSPSGSPVQITSADRIVSLSPGSGEIVWALGLGDSLVGIDLASVFPGSDSKTTVNPGHEVAIETVLGLKPNVVIADQSFKDSDAVARFEKLGIPVVSIPEAKTISEIDPRVMALADSLGVSGSGTELVKTMDQQLLESVRTDSSNIAIAFLYLRGSAGVYLLGGKGSGADTIIQSLGGTDVGTKLGIEGFAPLTAEALATSNPDVILVMNKGLESVGGRDKLLALPGVSSTTAGKNGAIMQADDRVLLSFGPQTAGVVSCLAKQLSAVTAKTS